MATNYPASLDSLTNPSASDNTLAVSHSSQHANANDAIEALEAKVGANSSAVTTSHDYKLSGVTGTDKAVSKTGSETLTNKTLTAPVLNGALSGTSIKDEDDMSSDSATAVPTQQSVKAYVDANGGGSTDGWTADADTWVYVSATSFKIEGSDETARFPIGTKIKLTQTTAKYFVVTSSSFSTDTTVNITGGADYTLANATITSPYYSYLETAQGWPGMFSWTPTYGATGSMTFGTVTTDIAKFYLVGKVCHFHIQARGTTGGTTSYGVTFTLPITLVNGGTGYPSAGGYVRTGASGGIMGFMLYSSATVAEVRKNDASNWSLDASAAFAMITSYTIA